MTGDVSVDGLQRAARRGGDATAADLPERCPAGSRRCRTAGRTPTRRARPPRPRRRQPSSSDDELSAALGRPPPDRRAGRRRTRRRVLAPGNRRGWTATDAEVMARLGRRQRGIRAAVRPGVPDPGGRSQLERDPGRTRRRLGNDDDAERAETVAAAARDRPAPTEGCDLSGNPEHACPRHQPGSSGRGHRGGAGARAACRSATASPTATAASAAIGPERLEAGDYPLRFASGSYFADAGRDCFYPEVVVVFTIADPDQHYHVPVLLNPFGYSTYRGT